VGLYNSSGGAWNIDGNGNGVWDGCGVDRCFSLGGSGYVPVAGDWNGDGKTDAGVVYDWGWGLGWYLDANGNDAWDGCGVDRCFFFGGGGSRNRPVAGDWNGDGKTDAGVVYDWGWGLGWYLDANGNGAWDGCGVDRCFFFGGAGSKPVAGDWNGDGKTDAGVVYDWGWGLGWYLDANGNGAWDGCSVDRCFFFGTSGQVPVAGRLSHPVMLGVYLSTNLQTAIGELVDMQNWLFSHGASGVTLAGDFMSLTFNPAWNVEHELEAAWVHGFVPFVNLLASDPWEGPWYRPECDTAEEIADGLCDTHLAVFADYYRLWVQKGGGRHAFLAPLPEANGYWARYSTDGPTFVRAFRRIRQVFARRGVPAESVRWVFAPNGWHEPDKPWKAFEYYYPGDADTDVVGFSSYNFGGCPEDTPWRNWDTFETAMRPYLDRMRAMAPSKPIFIAQTGTVGVPDDPADPNQNKSTWVYDTFSRLADYPGVKVILYYNRIKVEQPLPNCPGGPDFRVYYGGGYGEAGLWQILQDPRFGKIQGFNWPR
jgi:hypothetical protein